MNNNIRNRIAWFVAVLSLLLLVSCTKEIVEESWLELGSEEIFVTKKGYSYNGETAVITVKSNTYWVLSKDEGDTWVTSRIKGGANSMDIELTVGENDQEASRNAIFTFKTQQGLTRTVRVVQAGRSEGVVYVKDDYGTGAQRVSVNQYNNWTSEGVGSTRLLHSGTEAYVDNSSPSAGYEGASAGNNIVFGSNASSFEFGGINIKGDNGFILSFGSMTSASEFDTDDLRLFISKDQNHWTPISYTRSKGAGWEISMIPFVLAQSGIDQIYLRMECGVENAIRIDDVKLSEGGGFGETITFIEDIINKIDYLIFEDTFDWIEGKSGDYTNDKFGGNDDGAATPENGWTFESVWRRWHMMKCGTSTAPGRITTRKLAELGSTPSTIVLTFDAAAAYSMDYTSLMVSVKNAGTIFGESSYVFSMDKVQTWYSQSFVIEGATMQTQLEIGSALSAAEIGSLGTNRCILDNVRIYQRVKENPSAPVKVKVDPETLEYGKNAMTKSFRLDSNKDWTAVSSDGLWLKIDKNAGSYGTAIINVAVDQNNIGAPRQGKISIMVKDKEVATVAVTQSDIPIVTYMPIPTGLTVLSATTSAVTLEWDNIPDVVRKFQVEIASTATGEAIYSYLFDMTSQSASYNKRFILNRFTMPKLNPATNYVMRVKTISTQQWMEDSPFATINVKTAAKPNLGPEVLLYNDFSGCDWAGDAVLRSWGYKPSVVNNDTQPDAVMGLFASAETGATGNIGSMNETFKVSRNISGWVTTGVYEFPGCLKFGTGSGTGVITTTPLVGVDGSADIEISFKLATWSSTSETQAVTTDTFTLKVSAVGEGTVVGNNQFTMTDKFVWKDGFKVQINGVTAETKLKFETVKVTGGSAGARCLIDDILVVKR